MKWFLAPLLMLLSGCSGLPTTMRDGSYLNVPLKVVKANIIDYKNVSLRWGGTIIKVFNEKDSSQIQLLFYPINRYGRPRVDRKTQGRFAITSPQFLDPAIYKVGTEITVTGILSGEIKQKIDKKTIILPLLTADQIHIWPDLKNTDYRFYPSYHYYYDPYYRYSPFYRHNIYYHYYH